LPYIGGGQRYVQELGKELIKLGFDVHWMYTKLPNTKKEEIIDGIKCHRINVPLGRKFFSIASMFPAYKLAKKVDILQFDTFYGGFLGWLPGKVSRKPHVLVVYEFFKDLWNVMAKNKVQSLLYKTAEKYLANCPYNQFITISEYTKKKMIELGCDKKLIKVTYLGVDHDIFYPGYSQTFRREHGLEKKLILGWTGRMNLSQSKNLPMLIRSFKIINEKLPNTILAFDGPDFQNLIPIIKENGLEIGKDVIYNGCGKRSELPTFYCSIDVYVCSSLSEGFGLSVAEAEACGKPVVCFDAGALPEVVKDGKTGIVVKEKTPDAFADAVVELLEDAEKRIKYGTAANKWTEIFNWEKTAKETMEIYENLIEKSSK
jgi:glycosyltransferase involved in cell wall biosynthesis